MERSRTDALLLSLVLTNLLALVACGGGGRSDVVVINDNFVDFPSRFGVANARRPAVRWKAVAGAQRYEVEARYNSTSLPVTVTGTEAHIAVDVPNEADVDLTVRAIDAQGRDVGRDARRFRVRPVPDWMPTLRLTKSEAGAFGGYRLFNLLDLQTPASSGRVASLVLVNDAGEIVWWVERQGITDMLLAGLSPAGNPIVIERTVDDSFQVTSRAVERSFTGQEIWASDPSTLVHHDAGFGPDGHRMLLTWVFKTVDSISYEGDGIEVVDAVPGKVLWRWNIFDHFDPATLQVPESKTIGRSFKGQDWSHANAVVWDEARRVIWVCVRNFDLLLGVEYPSGRIAYSIGKHGTMGKDLLSHPHAPEVQADGSILLFDNGNTLDPRLSTVLHMRIDAATPAVDVLRRWVPDPAFYDDSLGDADMLENGNLLVTAGVSGRIFEVSPSDKVVWNLEIEKGTRIRMVYRAVQVPRAAFGDVGLLGAYCGVR